jgi:hypothetical protein
MAQGVSPRMLQQALSESWSLVSSWVCESPESILRTDGMIDSDTKRTAPSLGPGRAGPKRHGKQITLSFEDVNWKIRPRGGG